MIEEKISTSDRFQVELKSTYKLRHDKAHTAYTLEFYTFVPSNLGINNETYPKYLFYRDIQTYIRFKTPAVLLRDIATGAQSPLQMLEDSLQQLTRDQSEQNIKAYKNQNKMFCSVFRGAMRSHITLILDPHDPTDTGPLVEQYLQEVQHIVSEFRQRRSVINVPTINEELFSAYEYSDEYISLTVEQLTYELLQGIRTQKQKSGQTLTGRLIDLINTETAYRKKRHYPSTISADSDNEEFVYRSGVLKTYNESILLLNTHLRQEGKVVEQVIYSLAAGFAMIFATGVAFYTQAKYGHFTMAFFVALVVSYMFKDRIKELMRTYMNNHVQRLFYDHKVTICGGSGRRRIGYSRESFRFVTEKNLDPEICKLRNPDRFRDLDNENAGERVILYRKQIKLFSKNIDQIYQSHVVQGIIDITKLNIARFVRKMDNPKKALYITEDDSYRKVRGSKVYHINLVAKYISAEETSYARFRIILNRRGIKRIETVDTS